MGNTAGSFNQSMTGIKNVAGAPRRQSCLIGQVGEDLVGDRVDLLLNMR